MFTKFWNWLKSLKAIFIRSAKVQNAPIDPQDPPPAKPEPIKPLPHGDPAKPDPHGPSIMGVDVSHYETGFDFVKGKKDGVVFMMTKASEGTGLDKTCNSECAKAAAAGIKYKGIYHFHHAHISVDAQIDAFFKQYDSIQTEMGPILDLEETSVNGKTYAQVKESALEWLQKAEARSGRIPILYLDMNMLNLTGVNRDSRFNRYPRWIARYSSNQPPVDWIFWQFTDHGEQGADTDWFHGTEDDLKAFIENEKAA